MKQEALRKLDIAIQEYEKAGSQLQEIIRKLKLYAEQQREKTNGQQQETN